MLNFLQDINRRITNRANLTLLTKGICPACNEHAIYEHDGIYECHKCHAEFKANYNHPDSISRKKDSYKTYT